MTLRPGQVFTNPVTGERGVVRVAPEPGNGYLLVADLYARPGAAVVGEHVHPGLVETFTVVRGRLGVRHGGREVSAAPGIRLSVEPGVALDWWNAGPEETHVVLEVQPGERFEQLIRHLFFLAQDGRTNANGMPGPLQAVLLGREFADTVRFTSPPRAVQLVVGALLAPLARLTGRRGFYPRYMDREVPVVEVEPLPPEVVALIPGLAGVGSDGRGPRPR